MKTPDRWMDFWMTFAHWSWRWLPLLPFLLGGVILLIASLGAQMVGPVFPIQQERKPPIEGMRLMMVGGKEAWVQGNPSFVELGTVYDSRMNPMSGCVILEIK